MVADGYEGSLDQVARDLIATEVGQPADAITVHLRYNPMDRFGRPSQFSWHTLLLGLLARSAWSSPVSSVLTAKDVPGWSDPALSWVPRCSQTDGSATQLRIGTV